MLNCCESEFGAAVRMGQEGASMVILGSLVNGIATVFGGVLGLLFKRRMPVTYRRERAEPQ